jgi:acetylornithine deacetylase
MKAGIATNLFIAQALDALGIRLAGDLTIESVVDEEFGGVNGTLAGRARGYLADAAIITEPSFLRICPAHRGGRTVHITFRTPSHGILSGGMNISVADQLAWFLAEVPKFAAMRRASAPAHPAFAHVGNPVPVSVLKVTTGPWGPCEPMASASCCQVELFWQTLPGEDLAKIDAEFDAWFNQTIAARPGLFPELPEVVHPIRWLPASSMPHEVPLVTELAASAAAATGNLPPVQGIESPCDMFVFHQGYGIPAVLWGATGANTHLADEYVELDSVVASAKALLLFVHRWCGVAC